MTPYSSAQRVAFAAASAAALATATATIYYVYQTRRRNSKHKSSQSRTTVPDPDPNPLQTTQSSSSTQSSHPEAPPETSSRPLPQETEAERPVQESVPSTTNVTNTTTDSFAWAVFWDIENVPVPKTISTTHFVQALRKTLAAHRKQTHPDSILRIHAIANVRRTSVDLRHHLQANGVNVTHVESKGRKDAADKALITEICLVTREHPTPFGICLISGDGDFSYPVSRLAALGYATVVVAPTHHSFSTLLAAVPDAVIPLHTVLEGYDDPSLEPQVLRMSNQQTVRHPLSIFPLLAPLHVPRNADKRVTRRRRRERLMPPTTMAERDGDYRRPWGSDDDRSAIRLSDLRPSRRPPQPHVFPPNPALDPHILSNHLDGPYDAGVGNSRASPPRLMPPPQGQIQISDGPRRRGDRVSRDTGHQTYRHSLNGSATRQTTAPVDRTIPTRNGNVDGMRVSHSNQDNPKGAGNGPRVRFAGDIIIPEKGERTRPILRHNVPPGSEASFGDSQASRPRNNGDSKKQTSSAGSRDSPQVFTGSHSRWLYCGARALPFMVLLLVLGLSVLFTSLRVAIVVLEALQAV